MVKNLYELEKLILTRNWYDLIMRSLSNSYEQFIVNYYMNKIDYSRIKLLNILVTSQGTYKSSRGTVLAIVERASPSNRNSIRKSPRRSKRSRASLRQKLLWRRPLTRKSVSTILAIGMRDVLCTWNNQKNKKDTPLEGMSNLLVIEINSCIQMHLHLFLSRWWMPWI